MNLVHIINTIMISSLLLVVIEYYRGRLLGGKITASTRNILAGTVLWILMLATQFPAELDYFIVTPKMSLLYNLGQSIVILFYMDFAVDMNIKLRDIKDRNNFKMVTTYIAFGLILVSTISAVPFLPYTHVFDMSGATRLQTTGSKAGDTLFRIPLLYMLSMAAYNIPKVSPFSVMKYSVSLFLIARVEKLINSIFFNYENFFLNVTSQLISLTAVLLLSLGLLLILRAKRKLYS